MGGRTPHQVPDSSGCLQVLVWIALCTPLPWGPRSARDAPPAPPGQEVEHLLVVISDLGVDRPRPGRRRLVGGRRGPREERRNDPVGRPKAPNRGVMSWSRQYRTRTRHPCRAEPVPTLQRSVSTGIRPGQRVSFRVLHDGVVSLFSIRRMPRVKGRKRSSRGFAVRPAGEAPVPVACTRETPGAPKGRLRVFTGRDWSRSAECLIACRNGTLGRILTEVCARPRR